MTASVGGDQMQSPAATGAPQPLPNGSQAATAGTRTVGAAQLSDAPAPDPAAGQPAAATQVKAEPAPAPAPAKPATSAAAATQQRPADLTAAATKRAANAAAGGTNGAMQPQPQAQSAAGGAPGKPARSGPPKTPEEAERRAKRRKLHEAEAAWWRHVELRRRIADITAEFEALQNEVLRCLSGTVLECRLGCCQKRPIVTPSPVVAGVVVQRCARMLCLQVNRIQSCTC